MGKVRVADIMQPDNTNKPLRKPKLANKRPMYSINTNTSKKYRVFKDRVFSNLNSDIISLIMG